ncbi:hypothetical protein Tco_0765851 [Tanacetum coccineum]
MVVAMVRGVGVEGDGDVMMMMMAVVARGVGDRIDPSMRSIIGVRRKESPEKFSGDGDCGRRSVEREREIYERVRDRLPDLQQPDITSIRTNGDGMPRMRTFEKNHIPRIQVVTNGRRELRGELMRVDGGLWYSVR